MWISRLPSDLDQAPAGAAEPRIDAENANRMPGHGPLITPQPAARLGRFAPPLPIQVGHHNRGGLGIQRGFALQLRRNARVVCLPHRRNRRAVIIGGSMSGLFTAAFLRQIGWDVDVYERSSVELVGRGAGITGIRN